MSKKFVGEKGLNKLISNVKCDLREKVNTEDYMKEQTIIDTWNDVTGAEIPNANSLVHNHDELYYRKEDIDEKLSDIPLTSDDIEGAVSETRTINGKALSEDIELTANDISAVPLIRTINGKSLDNDISLTYEDVNASSETHNHDDLYYTESEIDELLGLKAGITEVVEESQKIITEIDKCIQSGSDIKDLIGSINDSGGTTSAGTVMAKLNKLLTDWTPTRAAKIDTINTNVSNLSSRLTSTRAGYIDTLANIGTTGDTGGTYIDGTVMAKLNKLLKDLTSSRAERIDTIYNIIGTTSNSGGTPLAGTVMGKLNASLLSENEIKNLIGQAGNSGGTAAAGTVMGKLNKLLTDWTTTRAGYMDSYIKSIGQTNNTGATGTTGTVMGKLNKIITLLENMK